MGFMAKIFRKESNPAAMGDAEKDSRSSSSDEPTPDMNDSSSDTSSEDVDDGVKQAQAIAAAWSKRSLFSAYAGIFLVFLMSSLIQQVSSNLTPYVTSAFSKHSLLATTSIMSSIIGAVAKLPIAKIINLWGRAEGYIVMVTLCTIGLIMMALCNGVETYAAAQVFYWIGYNGIVYVLDIFLADTSSLKNRGWLFAFTQSPFIVTTFAGPALAQAFHQSIGFRWAFGIFSIATPLTSLPVVAIFLRSRRKAEKMGYLRRQRSGRTAWESIKHYFVQFDVIGMIFIIAGFGLFLLPFSLATYQNAGWKSPAIISMLVIGFSCFIAFFVWERYGATASFAPFHLLRNPTVSGGCLLSATAFLSFYCWDYFFISYLQVVYDQSIRNAGYIANIFSIGGCIWALVIGGVVRYTGRFKWLAMCFIPLQMLGVGLMIYFRQPGSPIGFIIMNQVFIAISAGTIQICEQVAVMAAASHNDVAVVLAFLGLFSNLGGAIGQAISGAIWTHTVPGQLVKNLPESAKAEALKIYASLTTQLSYRMGSPERQAIIASYAHGQRIMLCVGLGVLCFAFVWVAMWKNIQLKNVKQVKGNVV
ncbi:hypothetical protein AJ80_01952 [Polytolypa hystricis UAMH7299]|uniref:Major facilitator superfamily (MFS) profile domain-containing protein n=1 Tax=Polytolypa hystricis (strain UAMH7299) TaxID=1447883 RepID=A0A2B7YZQ7_POLH7|nr:hypothetical protein AJ80_01952 [Polytolypa hystricis UAMH7299]